MSRNFNIAGREIGRSHPPYIICELSANHNGSLERALNLMEAAASTGCDAIKIQTYTADTITIDHDAPEFRVESGLWAGMTLHELYRKACTPYEWHHALFARARELGVTLFSSPFDETAVDLLASLDAPAYKIASFELVDLPLIAYTANRGKPLIMSTGMASLGEIQDAVTTARENGSPQVALLHCVSDYPAQIADANVATVPHLGAAFQCVSGLSDHTPGTAAAVASIALGGAIIEKHFTLSRAENGPDAAFSLEPHEFEALVADCRNAWKAVGRISYDLHGGERANVKFRRSLYVVADVAAGAELNCLNIRSIRPGFGLPPRHLPQVLGKRATRDLKRGERLSWDMIA